MSSNSTDHALDATLDVLSHSTRRYVLWYLDSEQAAVPVETLAATVAAWQADDGEADADARHQAHVSLQHVHLPRLESAGLIERTYECDRGRSESRDPDLEKSETKYVEATLDGTSVDAFFDAGLVGEFAESDRP